MTKDERNRYRGGWLYSVLLSSSYMDRVRGGKEEGIVFVSTNLFLFLSYSYWFVLMGGDRRDMEGGGWL